MYCGRDLLCLRALYFVGAEALRWLCFVWRGCWRVLCKTEMKHTCEGLILPTGIYTPSSNVGASAFIEHFDLYGSIYTAVRVLAVGLATHRHRVEPSHACSHVISARIFFIYLHVRAQGCRSNVVVTYLRISPYRNDGGETRSWKRYRENPWKQKR